jgi:hypothetical protein
MVGGLADWFAVTALFRHPLGVPIPHTAIVPKNKDRIGDTLAQFLRANFSSPPSSAGACAASTSRPPPVAGWPIRRTAADAFAAADRGSSPS